jgi:hypothetical protein
MEAITKKLPLLAFVLAAFAAVAFTAPQEMVTMYGFDGEHWYQIDDDTPPGSYTCESDTEPRCLYDAVEGQPINPEVNRKFVNVSLTPIAE